MSAARNITARGYRITTRANNMSGKKHGMAATPFQIRSCDAPAYLRCWRLSERLMPEQTQTARLDKLIPACASKRPVCHAQHGTGRNGAAGRWANLACLCVSARRQEDIGYGQ